ncbi:YchJ family protein [Erwinia tracheiphila]|uniref:UPF0225 protein AV903_05865 n=1 Tax=Erwinia tracheiphila TaxID=65700 RepID=A0A0M2K552_9GAMM|nr:YchJ family protein [Erwinia tracheiphila]AXF75727.1 YchJ family protein [Erwinia tracheiphila]EOS93421.1 hypothetical protein ETR_19151 [Erwinia tracheiphila PSU-1]KKF34505.1 hypothetical protein SY86_01980 [Erwinia tracheiphila]UIA81725.1 YchJ family protein [Erwinia tracheiphila]UIA86175.1 YchJ family protein [Erwinia tracheiphila]
MSEPCPCCSGLQYSVCCQPWLTGAALPPKPESLMRSRYTAYVYRDTNYLVATWHPSRQTEHLRTSLQQSIDATTWLGLTIISADVNAENSEGYVTFFARYSENHQEHFLHERSRFIQLDQRWYYVDGSYPETGRNVRCPCGSGKKFKKCCSQ